MKMKCSTIHKKLIFFLEGDLPATETKQIKLHISECKDCAAFAKEMEKTFAVLESEKSPAANPFFYSRLKAKMENRASEQNPIYRRPVLAKILQPAFFSLLLFVGIYSGIKIGQPSPLDVLEISYSVQDIPMLNEMEAEPIEAFLME